MRHGEGFKEKDFKDEDHLEVAEKDRYREGDMMEAADRDMIGPLSEILLLSEDQILEEGQTLEGEKVFVAIDHDQGVKIGLQISPNVSVVNVKLARR